MCAGPKPGSDDAMPIGWANAAMIQAWSSLSGRSS
jgi:hypothetical protein